MSQPSNAGATGSDPAQRGSSIPPPPPPGQQQPQIVYQVAQPVAQPSNGMAIASLVLGILGVFIPFLGVLALIFGGVGLSKANDGASGKGMAIAGLVLGILGTLVTLYIMSKVGSSPSY
jgi:uncharacterized protein DUF4190